MCVRSYFFRAGAACALALLPAWYLPAAQTPPAPAIQIPSSARQSSKAASQAFPPALIETGNSLFQRDCAFCHGRDAGGGETGPDLTRSKLVGDDTNGEKITPVVRAGRPDKGMPPFSLSDAELKSLVAFIHTQKTKAESQHGGRRGVDVEDLQTGNFEEGKRYFNGAGGCSSCHSPTGDLAGVASRFQGLKLEQRMLYPRDAKSKVSVTLPSGQTIDGRLGYLDEFTVGLIDSSGSYHSWSTRTVKFTVDSPVDAHADLLNKYSDSDIHNLMAYLQTLK